MRAVIKGFEGLGREEPETYVSPDPLDDAFGLRMLVGPPDGPGEESFDVLVGTPAWLARVVSEEGPKIGRLGHWEFEDYQPEDSSPYEANAPPPATALTRSPMRPRKSSASQHCGLRFRDGEQWGMLDAVLSDREPT